MTTQSNDHPDKPFTPPSSEQVADYLAQWMPQPASPWSARAPMIGLIAALVLMLLIPHPLAALLPWIAFVGVLVNGTTRLKAAQALEREVSGIGEQAMLRRYRQALRRAWRVLPRLVHHPILHGRAVAAMAHSLDDLGAHESAMAAYDHLLGGMPEAGPATVHLQISRAIAALRTDRLADGDDALRKLRGGIGPYQGTPIGAAFRMAQLIQDVQTHHYQDALEFEPNLIDDLRPLGVEAGFGYALMALCLYEARPESPRDQAERHAAVTRWWANAAMLLPPQSLTREFPALQILQDGQAQDPSGPA